MASCEVGLALDGGQGVPTAGNECGEVGAEEGAIHVRRSPTSSPAPHDQQDDTDGPPDAEVSPASQEKNAAIGTGTLHDDINGLAVVADIQGTGHDIQSMPSPPVKMRKDGREPSFFAMHPSDDVNENSTALSSSYKNGQKSAMKSGSRRMDLSVQVAQPEDGEAAHNAYDRVGSRNRRSAEQEVDRWLQGLPIGTVLTVNKIVIKAQAHIRGVMARKAHKQRQQISRGDGRARLTGAAVLPRVCAGGQACPAHRTQLATSQAPGLG